MKETVKVNRTLDLMGVKIVRRNIKVKPSLPKIPLHMIRSSTPGINEWENSGRDVSHLLDSHQPRKEEPAASLKRIYSKPKISLPVQMKEIKETLKFCNDFGVNERMNSAQTQREERPNNLGAPSGKAHTQLLKEWLEECLKENPQEEDQFSIYQLCLKELIREVSVEYAQRGKLISIVTGCIQNFYQKKIEEYKEEIKENKKVWENRKKELKKSLRKELEFFSKEIARLKTEKQNFASENEKFQEKLIYMKKKIQSTRKKYTYEFPFWNNESQKGFSWKDKETQTPKSEFNYSFIENLEIKPVLKSKLHLTECIQSNISITKQISHQDSPKQRLNESELPVNSDSYFSEISEISEELEQSHPNEMIEIIEEDTNESQDTQSFQKKTSITPEENPKLELLEVLNEDPRTGILSEEIKTAPVQIFGSFQYKKSSVLKEMVIQKLARYINIGEISEEECVKTPTDKTIDRRSYFIGFKAGITAVENTDSTESSRQTHFMKTKPEFYERSFSEEIGRQKYKKSQKRNAFLSKAITKRLKNPASKIISNLISLSQYRITQKHILTKKLLKKKISIFYEKFKDSNFAEHVFEQINSKYSSKKIAIKYMETFICSCATHRNPFFEIFMRMVQAGQLIEMENYTEATIFLFFKLRKYIGKEYEESITKVKVFELINGILKNHVDSETLKEISDTLISIFDSEYVIGTDFFYLAVLDLSEAFKRNLEEGFDLVIQAISNVKYPLFISKQAFELVNEILCPNLKGLELYTEEYISYSSAKDFFMEKNLYTESELNERFQLNEITIDEFDWMVENIDKIETFNHLFDIERIENQLKNHSIPSALLFKILTKN